MLSDSRRSLTCVLRGWTGCLRRVAVLLMLLSVPTAVCAHPFHTSIAEIEWNPQTRCFEVAMRMSSLELEQALKTAGFGTVNLDRTAASEPAVERYIAERFAVSCADPFRQDAEECALNWVGMELEKLDLWVYFELMTSSAAEEQDLANPRPQIEIRPATRVGARPVLQTVQLPDSVTLRNTVLMELNPLQVNFANVSVGGTAESAHFTAEAPEATLTFFTTEGQEEDGGLAPQKSQVPPPKGMRQDVLIPFDGDDAAARWEPTDVTAWEIGSEDGNAYYALTKKRSDFSPTHRSPFNRSLLKDREYGTFVLDVRLRSTIPDYNHRDLCVFFGYQDDDHLYYVHLGKRTDDHANQIFIVNDAPRTKISEKTTAGIPWDDEWHRVRVERNAESGRIAVYFDDMDQPVMTATDRTFRTGRVGIGSFDDTGHFDEFSVWVPQAD